MNFEGYIIDHIEQRRKGLRFLLYLLSLVYRGCVTIRHFLYDHGVKTSYELPCFVISVGNIVAGGTGKTPLVCKLLKSLEQEKVAILTRGYRSLKKSSPLLVTQETKTQECGDEARWLFLQTGKAIWVGKNRYQSGLKALEEGAECLILEDGLQHRALKRDVEIVLLAEEELFGKGYFLPRGYLRDRPQRLEVADVVIVRRSTDQPLERLLPDIRKYTEASVLEVIPEYDLLPSLHGKKVGAFCGIAKPQLFYKALQKHVEIVDTATFLDHKLPSTAELVAFAKRCRELGAVALVCTAKDEVKIQGELPLPVEVLQMELVCDKNLWNEMIHTLQTGIHLKNRKKGSL